MRINITSYADTAKIQEVEEGNENSQGSGKGGRCLSRDYRRQRNNKIHTLIDDENESGSSLVHDDKRHLLDNMKVTEKNQTTFNENEEFTSFIND